MKIIETRCQNAASIMFTLSKLLCTSATLLPLAQCQQIFDYVIVGGVSESLAIKLI